MRPLSNTRIKQMYPIVSPQILKERLPLTSLAEETVQSTRSSIQKILGGHDPRMLVIVGPCSVHSPEETREYAELIRVLQDKVNRHLFLVMRTYFEKPRTVNGWTGLIYDPHMNGSGDMSAGLSQARQLMLYCNELGVPTATEFLDPLVPQFIDDLVAWAAIGARTTESQTHRGLASGLSMPVGYKNGTDGSLEVAIHALQSAQCPHTFIGINEKGQSAVARTAGNPDGHIILRGGKSGTNYDAQSIQSALETLRHHGLSPRLMVDCSHGNSEKQHERQIDVCRQVVQQRADGMNGIMGIMLESNINAGAQKIPSDLVNNPVNKALLRYGVSVTDACIGWKETEGLLLAVHDTIASQQREAVV